MHHNLKQAQASAQRDEKSMQECQLEPKVCTIIRLPKQTSGEFLTNEQKQYIAENVGKLDAKGSEGIRDVVKNHVVPDEEGNMDFELEQLPYEIGKNLYKHIKTRLRMI